MTMCKDIAMHMSMIMAIGTAMCMTTMRVAGIAMLMTMDDRMITGTLMNTVTNTDVVF